MKANRPSRLWTIGLAIIGLQCALTYGFSREEFLPSPPPLDSFPRALGPWDRSQDILIDEAALELLGPDDVLNRNYAGTDQAGSVNLFIVYYTTQHRARNAHDPKVCLPGSGWEPQESRVIELPNSTNGEPLQVNYYVIKKGEQEAVVLYWFQTHAVAVAMEQALRLERIRSSVFDRRTDMALVRIVVPVHQGRRAEAGDRAAEFASIAHPYVLRYFPQKPGA
jgi:EpsI family protein